MEKTFQLEIIASDRVFFQGEVEHLVITAIDGLLGIMAG
ncbi:MAG: ATP synthase F1 subunit epsilon, partial [Ruminococcus sp.]|nr:ATP synthase F1 subunit epsilon [Ruminococcus sp.]